MANAAEEHEPLVKASKLRPVEMRSFDLTRGHLLHVDYVDAANAKTAIQTTVETAPAIENISETANIKGLDGVYNEPN